MWHNNYGVCLHVCPCLVNTSVTLFPLWVTIIISSLFVVVALPIIQHFVVLIWSMIFFENEGTKCDGVGLDINSMHNLLVQNHHI